MFSQMEALERQRLRLGTRTGVIHTIEQLDTAPEAYRNSSKSRLSVRNHFRNFLCT